MVKLTKLEDTLENLKSEVHLGTLVESLGLENTREIRVMVSAAIRLGGYRAERAVTWDPKIKRTVTDIMVFPGVKC
jgi:hypothetical protein